MSLARAGAKDLGAVMEGSRIVRGLREAGTAVKDVLSVVTGKIADFAEAAGAKIRSWAGRGENAARGADDSADMLRGTNRTGEVTNRASFRKATENRVVQQADKGPNGLPRCALCGNEVPLTPRSGWNIDHIRAWTRRLFEPDVTRAAVRDDYQLDVPFTCKRCNQIRGAGD